MPRLRPWIWELVPHYEKVTYHWLVKNRVMESDDLSMVIKYRDRTPADVICGERTFHARDGENEKELVCTVIGDHGEMPHIGVDAECADMTCEHWRQGRRHIVITGFSIRVAAGSTAPPGGGSV